MNNSKLIAVTTGEPWVGLVDGTYAVIITLLALELPALIIQIIEKNSQNASSLELATAILVDIAGYLFATILFYDIWSIHKGFLSISKATRFSSISTMIILWFGTLVPPAIYLVQYFSQKIILHEVNSLEAINKTSFEVVLFRLGEMGLIIMVYIILDLVVKHEQKERIREQDNKYRRELLDTSRIISFRMIISLILIVISFFISTGVWAEMPLALLAIATLVPYELYKAKTISII